ncbi:hypothetical protein PROFUN_02025 [Planoprotostelium fungivorum]|uniref:Uncharacterized protein n=1 Tax=Planoprotostelium fungivorum TaxID=1890364 RepID=A0A2P6NB71_9EUKA|nr:hypothetical protein PROFUN_02025 [Planoprotostelium fungivorum]
MHETCATPPGISEKIPHKHYRLGGCSITVCFRCELTLPISQTYSASQPTTTSSEMSFGDLKPMFVAVGTFVILAFIITGAICIPFSFRVTGRIDRTRGFCTVQASQVVLLSGKGLAYRPVFQVTVYTQANSTTPYQTYAAAYTGDLSSEAYYTANNPSQRAYNALQSFPVGSTYYNCLYPERALTYPTGASVFNINVAFLGNYTDGEIAAAKRKANSLIVAGIVLLSIGGFLLLSVLSVVGFRMIRKFQRGY